MTILNSFFPFNESYPNVHAIEVRNCEHELIDKYIGIGYVDFDNEKNEEENDCDKKLED